LELFYKFHCLLLQLFFLLFKGKLKNKKAVKKNPSFLDGF
jgi:hypothetical protein